MSLQEQLSDSGVLNFNDEGVTNFSDLADTPILDNQKPLVIRTPKQPSVRTPKPTTSIVRGLSRPSSSVRTPKPTTSIVRGLSRPSSSVRTPKPTTSIVRGLSRPSSSVRTPKPTTSIVRGLSRPSSISSREQQDDEQDNEQDDEEDNETSSIVRDLPTDSSIYVENIEQLKNLPRNYTDDDGNKYISKYAPLSTELSINGKPATHKDIKQLVKDGYYKMTKAGMTKEMMCDSKDTNIYRTTSNGPVSCAKQLSVLRGRFTRKYQSGSGKRRKTYKKKYQRKTVKRKRKGKRNTKKR